MLYKAFIKIEGFFQVIDSSNIISLLLLINDSSLMISTNKGYE